MTTNWKAMLERIEGQPLVCIEPAENNQKIVLPVSYHDGRIYWGGAYKLVSEVKFINWSNTLNAWVITWT